MTSLGGSDGFNSKKDTFFWVKLVLHAIKLNDSRVVVVEDTMPRLENKLKMEANVLAIL